MSGAGKKYGKCGGAIKWWTNYWLTKNEKYKATTFSINYIKLLKEFLLENPPDFPVANRCCEFAKKKVVKKYIKEHNTDLDVTGIRKAEGGIRAANYKNCFTPGEDKADTFRPIFYFTDADKEYYCEHFGVKHSACYEVYGLKRTGCVGCPYNQRVLEELKTVEIYEPKLYKACMNVFGKAYEYTQKFHEFRAKKKAEVQPESEIEQMSLFDLNYDFLG